MIFATVLFAKYLYVQADGDLMFMTLDNTPLSLTCDASFGVPVVSITDKQSVLIECKTIQYYFPTIVNQ